MQKEWHKAIKSLKKYIHLSIYVYKNGGLPSPRSHGRPGAFQSGVTELVFLNVYGAPESIPRNEFHQPM